MQSAPALGLYIHVPFCKSKCVYCDFYSLPGADEARMDDYTGAVIAHLTGTAPRAAGYRVDTVYFGGGTPSLLGAKRLCRILKTVRKRCAVTKDAEITLEANPDSIGDAGTLRQLRQAGFNRISLGMQSADDELLRRLGRIHTARQVGEAVAAAREAGFGNLSVDLIYGLPRQTTGHWLATLEAAAALDVQHVSCYGLKVEEGTPLFACRETAGLPDDEAQADMYLAAVEFLEKRGYRQYEISNFAREGFASRHNLKYWTLGEYAGFGPGAHSDFGGVRYAFSRDLDGYVRGVREGAPLLSECQRIPPAERDAEYLMLRLRTAEGFSPAGFRRQCRRRFDCFLPFLENCRKAGYAVCEADGSWHLTPRGFLLSNQIIGQMQELLLQDKQARADAAARGDLRVRTD